MGGAAGFARRGDFSRFALPAGQAGSAKAPSGPLEEGPRWGTARGGLKNRRPPPEGRRGPALGFVAAKRLKKEGQYARNA